ncbi:MAG: HlyC/CorC family transporter [Chlamydiae bacterium CG10_big_fil_rev_8_21_14_0_10_35_9]|nr:MAG: HlyC/CorC family transporter [Chlamydiae bacterium CG10_big_fil_rev_8_21_14_0_10_35_9]
MNMIMLSAFALFGAMCLSAFNAAYFGLEKFEAKEFLQKKKLFFFFTFFRKFFSKDGWKTLYFAISSTKHILIIIFAIASCFFLLQFGINPYIILLSILGASIAAEFLTRSIATIRPRLVIRFSAFFSSIYLLLLFPLVGILLQITRSIFEASKVEEEDPSIYMEEKIKDMVRDSEFIQYLEPYDQKLIHSFISFRKRVAREVMIPRVDIISVPVNATLSQATAIFAEEEYSRLPVYKNSLDEIVGVLLYKDLLKFYAEQKKDEKLTHFSVEEIMKPVIYSPENKKISHLLQEIRNKQIHMAIVVNEYGGTEGIITIEDILEEIVGEIEDEFDTLEEELYSELPNGEWIVDAKMSIIDIESKLGIHLPHNPEYETIGGYVFHRAGTIPSKGWKLHHDKFELEVVSSSERCIDKIRIIPLTKSPRNPS